MDKEQLPKTLGPGPEWREPQRGKKGRGDKKPQGRKSEVKPQEKNHLDGRRMRVQNSPILRIKNRKKRKSVNLVKKYRLSTR